MNTAFQIEEEVDKLVDKFAEQLKDRVKKAVIRSEKNVLRQYIASQKETTKFQKEPNQKKSLSVPFNNSRKMTQKMPPGRPSSRREQNYEYASSTDSE